MIGYPRNEEICAAARLRLTEAEAANTLARRASLSVEIRHSAYPRRRWHIHNKRYPKLRHNCQQNFTKAIPLKNY